MNTSERNTVNKAVGIKNGEIYFIEYFFNHGENFKGATGYSMRPLTEGEIDAGNMEENYIEYYREIWKEAVRADQTEDGLEDFAENAAHWDEGLYPGDDPSFRDEAEGIIAALPEVDRDEIRNYCGDYQTWQCSSCGRIFSKDLDFDYVFDVELLDKIREIEN